MQSLDNNTQAFLALVRAGLWEQDVRLLPYQDIKWQEVYRLATEQSVLGLVLAGLEHSDVKPPKEFLLQWIGEVQQIEQRNKAMNAFIAELIEQLRKEDIYALLVKGQGIARCYERPLWRSCGDVDFLLSEDNYVKARTFLNPMADSVEKESDKDQGMNFGPWVVEIHGNQHCGLSARMDSIIDEVQNDIFYRGNVRTWMNGNTLVFLPSENNDAIILFTHYLKHFYKGGLGLRQVCDWCRLLWRYKDSLNHGLLESLIRQMGLKTEWKAFAALAVNFMGMPKEAMPLYSPSNIWIKKARRIIPFIIKVGNMGHNRDKNIIGRKNFVVRKMTSFCQRVMDFCNHLLIFPIDTIRFFPSIVFNGIRLAAKGIG